MFSKSFFLDFPLSCFTSLGLRASTVRKSSNVVEQKRNRKKPIWFVLGDKRSVLFSWTFHKAQLEACRVQTNKGQGGKSLFLSLSCVMFCFNYQMRTYNNFLPTVKLFSCLYLFTFLSRCYQVFFLLKTSIILLSFLVQLITYALIMKTPFQLTRDFRTPSFTSVCELILCFVKLFKSRVSLNIIYIPCLGLYPSS